MTIDSEIQKAKELVSYYQAVVERTPEHQFLQECKKFYFQLVAKKQELEQEEQRRKNQSEVQKLKDKGYECRIGHKVSSTESVYGDGENYTYIIVHKDTSPIREMVETSTGYIVLNHEPGTALHPNLVKGYGEEEDDAWEVAIKNMS